jgi:hypothetical protein
MDIKKGVISIQEYLKRHKKESNPRGEFFRISVTQEQRAIGFIKTAKPQTYVEGSINRYKSMPNPVESLKQEYNEIEKHLKKWIIQHEQEEKQRKLDFAKKRAIELLPENEIPRRWLGQRAYPRLFREMERSYNAKDFERVRQLALDGKIPELASTELTTQFVTYLNSVIQKKS